LKFTALFVSIRWPLESKVKKRKGYPLRANSGALGERRDSPSLSQPTALEWLVFFSKLVLQGAICELYKSEIFWQFEFNFSFRAFLRLKVFENRVLMRVFGPRRDEVTGQ
jgi:hypothetical protein